MPYRVFEYQPFESRGLDTLGDPFRFAKDILRQEVPNAKVVGIQPTGEVGVHGQPMLRLHYEE